MTDNALGSQVVTQVAIVVEDIDKASRAWAELLGVEQPEARLTAPEEETHIRYRGESTNGRAKLAFFRTGQVSLELIQPVGGPSTWREFLDERGEGIHHIAFHIKGMDDVLVRLEGQGIDLVQRGDYKGGRYAYVDGTASLGAVLELLENF